MKIDKNPLLQVVGLTTHFVTDAGERIVKAVDNVSFELNYGDTLALIGESGCGKSTVALSLLRVLPPAAKVAGGKIMVVGEDLFT
jgi:ABC-type oligopeptide transport system ATPase subunit